MQTLIDEISRALGPAAFAVFAAFGILIFIALLRSLYYTCAPNQVLIFSGRRRRLNDGSFRGFRVEQGGGWRFPILEKVDKINLSLMEVPISIRGAFSRGGIPLNVDAVANVKISSDMAVVSNAIERFLGRDPNEIRRVAKETLEGHLRGVLARLTPEEINEDRLKFAEELTTESEHDLRKLGIHLDTFKILHVSDDKHYLDSIGREAIARVIRNAEIAESDAEREAELEESANLARGSVKMSEAQANIGKMKNDLRKVTAELEATVRSEEERTLAAARQARAFAEQELQLVRAELEMIRLQTDKVVPAEAQRRASELRARGEAAIIREKGLAASQALDMLNQAWKEAGDQALAIYLIEDIENILAKAGRGVAKMKIEHLELIDNGDGKTLSNYVSAYPAMLKSVFEAVRQTTGIDIPASIGADDTAPKSEVKK